MRTADAFLRCYAGEITGMRPSHQPPGEKRARSADREDGPDRVELHRLHSLPRIRVQFKKRERAAETPRARFDKL
jgi:hypothetical protein